MIGRKAVGSKYSHLRKCFDGNVRRSLITARKRDQSIFPMRTSNTALLVCDMQEVFRSRIHNMDSVILNSTTLTNVANVLDLKTIVTEQYPEKLKHTIPEISDALGERSVVFPKTKISMMTSDVLRKLDRWETTVKYGNPLKNTLFVGNLNFEVTEGMLRDMFEKNYTVREAKITYAFDENGNRTQSKGYGLVTLDRSEELEYVAFTRSQPIIQSRSKKTPRHNQNTHTFQ